MGLTTETNWHIKSVSEVLEILKSGEHGLTSDEAKRRLDENGPNVLPESQADSAARLKFGKTGASAEPTPIEPCQLVPPKF